MNLSQKIIVFFGFLVIVVVSLCSIFKSDISFFLTSRRVEREYGQMTSNNYYIMDNFYYVDNYDKAEVHSKEEIIDSIYYLINSGVSYAERYCAREYTSCYQDMEAISSDTNLLSILNNYVHPYNSFDSIVFNFDDRIMEIEIKHTYSSQEIAQISSRVDEIIKKNLNSGMSSKEKIKSIHDYIINHTEYDTLKTKDVNNNTYKSNTAYGVLFQGYGICSGYSDAMKLFLDKLGIINYKVSNDQHIWNLVYLDGKWLHLDLTWDDPVSDKNVTRDSYFLVPYQNLKKLDDDVHYFDGKIFKEAMF